MQIRDQRRSEIRILRILELKVPWKEYRKEMKRNATHQDLPRETESGKNVGSVINGNVVCFPVTITSMSNWISESAETL